MPQIIETKESINRKEGDKIAGRPRGTNDDIEISKVESVTNLRPEIEIMEIQCFCQTKGTMTEPLASPTGSPPFITDNSEIDTTKPVKTMNELNKTKSKMKSINPLGPLNTPWDPGRTIGHRLGNMVS